MAPEVKKKKVLDNPKKKNFQPLQISNPLQLKDIAEALTDIAPDSIVHTAVANDEAEVDIFIHGAPNVNCCVSVYDIFQRSKNREELFTNFFLSMDKVNTCQIEYNTRGQAENDEWFKKMCYHCLYWA